MKGTNLRYKEIIKGLSIGLAILTIATIAIGTQHFVVADEAASEEEQVSLRATLVDSNNEKHGEAQFEQTDSDTKALSVLVEGIAADTEFNVVTEDTHVGSITTNEDGKGELSLSTANENAVPDVQSANIIEIQDTEGNVVLSGTFGEEQEQQIHLKATLVDSNNERHGEAQFEQSGNDAKSLHVVVEGILADTEFNVIIGEECVGTITTNADGNGELNLNTANEDTVPDVLADHTIEIQEKNGNVILSGTFGEEEDEQQEND